MDLSQHFDLYEYHNYFQGKIHLSYKGPWDEHMLSTLGIYLKSLLKDDPVVKNKIFKIFMELAQNISLHSAEYSKLDQSKTVGIGTIVISEQRDHYYFYFGNMIKNMDVFPIIDKCEVINNLSREELRAFKRKQRNLPFGEKGGGNIGLIQAALSSDNPLDINLTPVSDEISFLTLCVSIKVHNSNNNTSQKD